MHWHCVVCHGVRAQKIQRRFRWRMEDGQTYGHVSCVGQHGWNSVSTWNFPQRFRKIQDLSVCASPRRLTAAQKQAHPTYTQLLNNPISSASASASDDDDTMTMATMHLTAARASARASYTRRWTSNAGVCPLTRLSSGRETGVYRDGRRSLSISSVSMPAPSSVPAASLSTYSFSTSSHDGRYYRSASSSNGTTNYQIAHMSSSSSTTDDNNINSDSIEAPKDEMEFQAETRQLLDIVTHSLYTDKEVFLR